MVDTKIVGRNKDIDIVKGLGILLMVYGHSVTNFAYVALFHMSLFFIASGYLFNKDRTDGFLNYRTYILKKIKSLWVPYIEYNIMFVFLHNIFIKMNIYTDNPLFLTKCNNSITKIFEVHSMAETLKEVLYVLFFQGDTQIGGRFGFCSAYFT